MGTTGIKKKPESQEKKVFIPDFLNYGSSMFYQELELMDSEKNKEKFIKVIESVIRTSLEYRSYIKYLKTEALLNYCTLFNQMPEEISAKLKIEMHHCPLGLYDIVDVVLTKYLLLEKPFTRLSIANEVMDAHYMNQIGIVPMTITAHQMAHNGVKLINVDDVFGGYQKFIEFYKPFISEDMTHKVYQIENLKTEFIEGIRSKMLEINPQMFIEYDDSDDDQVEIPKLESNEENLDISNSKSKKNKSLIEEFEQD